MATSKSFHLPSPKSQPFEAHLEGQTHRNVAGGSPCTVQKKTFTRWMGKARQEAKQTGFEIRLQFVDEGKGAVRWDGLRLQSQHPAGGGRRLTSVSSRLAFAI